MVPFAGYSLPVFYETATGGVLKVSSPIDAVQAEFSVPLGPYGALFLHSLLYMFIVVGWSQLQPKSENCCL